MTNTSDRMLQLRARRFLSTLLLLLTVFGAISMDWYHPGDATIMPLGMVATVSVLLAAAAFAVLAARRGRAIPASPALASATQAS